MKTLRMFTVSGVFTEMNPLIILHMDFKSWRLAYCRGALVVLFHYKICSMLGFACLIWIIP